MKLLTKLLFVSILCLGLSSCEGSQDAVEYDIMGRAWTGDVGMNVDGEPIFSTFYFGTDGFGEERQYYVSDNAPCDTYRFQWIWEDSYSRNLILDYGREGISYMDDIRVIGNEMRGIFYLSANSPGVPFVLYME